jgi:hypothetical protein
LAQFGALRANRLVQGSARAFESDADERLRDRGGQALGDQTIALDAALGLQRVAPFLLTLTLQLPRRLGASERLRAIVSDEALALGGAVRPALGAQIGIAPIGLSRFDRPAQWLSLDLSRSGAGRTGAARSTVGADGSAKSM